MIGDQRPSSLELGINLIAADSPNAFQDDTPTAKLVRQVLGAIAEFDKAMTVVKLRGARERMRKAVGKCESRKSQAEMHPAVVREAKRLGRAKPKTGEHRSLRRIAAELAKIGEALSARGLPSAKEAQGAGESVLELPDQIEWKAPAVSPGPGTAVLFGHPSKPRRIRDPHEVSGGPQALPHTHPDEWRTVVVLSGTIYFALGDKWDESKLKPRPAGTFFSEAKGAPHFVWAKDGEVVIQTTGMGPTGTTLILQ